MPGVNLIAKRRALQINARRIARLGGVGVVACAGLITLCAMLMLAELRLLEHRATELETDVALLRPTLARYRHARQTQEQLAERARFYLQARASQDWWLGWLYELQARLPQEAWLTALDTQGTGGKRSLIIDGGAQSEQLIAGYVAELGKSKLGSQCPSPPRLVFMRLVSSADGEYQQFQISMSVPGSEAAKP